MTYTKLQELLNAAVRDRSDVPRLQFALNVHNALTGEEWRYDPDKRLLYSHKLRQAITV